MIAHLFILLFTAYITVIHRLPISDNSALTISLSRPTADSRVLHQLSTADSTLFYQPPTDDTPLAYLLSTADSTTFYQPLTDDSPLVYQVSSADSTRIYQLSLADRTLHLHFISYVTLTFLFICYTLLTPTLGVQ